MTFICVIFFEDYKCSDGLPVKTVYGTWRARPRAKGENSKLYFT